MNMTSSLGGLLAEVESAIVRFEDAAFLDRVRKGSVTVDHYHLLLTTIFHQTRNGPYSFASAAANCSWRHAEAKDYLLRHAEEERTHWRWILDDLASTHYSGPDPQLLHPHPSCEVYIAFNERAARVVPVSRLAVAAVLEGIGARYGGKYGGELLKALGLKPAQASFFMSHGQTDKVHIEELEAILSGLRLSGEEWAWMSHAAATAGHLYRAMYDLESFR